MNPSSQPPAVSPPAPDDTPFKTDMIQDIPMQTQAPSQPVAEKDDVELDLMMQDVGQELKKNVKRPTKHHFFSKKSKQPEIPQPQSAPQSTTPPAQPSDTATLAQSPAQTQSNAQPAAKTPPKPKTKHSVPIFIILVTIIITAALVVAAVATYKQK